MKKRLKEIEEEAGALREMQAKVEKEMAAVQGLNFALCFFICRLVLICYRATRVSRLGLLEFGYFLLH